MKNILLLLLIPTLLISGNLVNLANALVKDSDVILLVGIVEIRGHMLQAIENKKEGNIENAISHTLHPLAEVYPSIKYIIAKKDPQLAFTIEDRLVSLNKDIRVLSIEEVYVREDEIKHLLQQAYNSIVSEEKRLDVSFLINVMLQVLEDAMEEYGEGVVEEGKVENIIEWQDAIGFTTITVEDIFPLIKGKVDEALGLWLEDRLTSILQDMRNKKGAEHVSASIYEIDSRVRSLLQVSEEPSIPKMKELLELALNSYQMGVSEEEPSEAEERYDETKEYISIAYERHLLPLRQYIEEIDKELMTVTEYMLKDELPKMIDERVSVETMKSKIDELNGNIDKIIAIGVIPEFPYIAGIILAFTMLFVLALTSINKLHVIR